jgi:hypothetical protein
MAFHLTDDIVRGMEPGGVSTLVGVLILVVWLYGTLVLAERRAGYVIILLGSVGGSGVPVVHMMGAGLVGGEIANSSGVLFLGLDTHRARRDRDLLRHPLGARTMEPAMGSVAVVQQREDGKTNPLPRSFGFRPHSVAGRPIQSHLNSRGVKRKRLRR